MHEAVCVQMRSSREDEVRRKRGRSFKNTDKKIVNPTRFEQVTF